MSEPESPFGTSASGLIMHDPNDENVRYLEQMLRKHGLTGRVTRELYNDLEDWLAPFEDDLTGD